MNVLIVEDEAHTASLLKEIIEQDENFIVTEIIESVVDAVAYLHKNQKKLDLLFFDIQLADGKSFEIFKNIDVEVPVVFCTAFDDYSFEAIKNNGINYVLKPFKETEIHQALQKFLRLRESLGAGSSLQNLVSGRSEKQFQKNFLCYQKEKAFVISVQEIALFAVEFETVYLYTLSGKKYALFKKMEYYESTCDPDQFFRINRQMLVNQDAILSFQPYFNRKVILELTTTPEEKPIVSRLKVSAFKEWIEKSV